MTQIIEPLDFHHQKLQRRARTLGLSFYVDCYDELDGSIKDFGTLVDHNGQREATSEEVILWQKLLGWAGPLSAQPANLDELDKLFKTPGYYLISDYDAKSVPSVVGHLGDLPKEGGWTKINKATGFRNVPWVPIGFYCVFGEKESLTGIKRNLKLIPQDTFWILRAALVAM